MSVSRETADGLALYVDRLKAWQRIKNLVAPSTLDQVWTRHMADSAQLLALAPEARRWVDLGSGAGFPGLVIAILLREQSGARVELIESNDRKCAFLRDVARATGAPAHVHADRIQAVLPRLEPGVEVVTARALAGFPACVALSRSLLDCGATGLFLTGRHTADPVALPDPSAYDVDTVPSRTRAEAWITRVRARPASDARPASSLSPG